MLLLHSRNPAQGLLHPLNIKRLHQVIIGIYLKGLRHIFRVGRCKNNFGLRLHVHDHPGAVNAVHPVDLNIHEDHLRPVSDKKRNRVGQIVAFAVYFKAFVSFYDFLQKRAHPGVIFHQHYSHSHIFFFSSGRQALRESRSRSLPLLKIPDSPADSFFCFPFLFSGRILLHERHPAGSPAARLPAEAEPQEPLHLKKAVLPA